MPAPGTKPIKIGNILVSALHLVGVVVLFLALILHICGMWSPRWSAWQGPYGHGSTHKRTGTANDNWYYYNGPWMKTVCSYDDQQERDRDVQTSEYGRARGKWSYAFWIWGTRRADKECTERVLVADHCIDYYEFDKCGHLTAVRVLTCIAMVLGLIALVLSIVGIVSVTGPKYPCIGSCLLAFIAGLCIFIAICIWASIKDMEREEMRIICSNFDDNYGSSKKTAYDCWGEIGKFPAGPDDDDPCNDECDKIDPPYGLAYAYGLCIIAMFLFVIGGALVGAAGLNKRIPSK